LQGKLDELNSSEC